MIFMDGVILDRVAVSVAVGSSILQTRVRDYRTCRLRVAAAVAALRARSSSDSAKLEGA
jgi:hypothetical protein